MSMKKKPTGFVAVCQCGQIIGAMDYDRTDRKEAGKILGRWLDDGCSVISKFDRIWQEKISQCLCDR